MAKLPKLPKLSLGFALSAALLPLLCFSYVSASHARIGGHWNDALIDGGTFDSEPKLDSSEDSGLEVNRQSDATAPVECGHYFLNPGQSVTIKSKNYPGKHPIRHTCKWFFQGTSCDSTISIACDDFQLQGKEYGCLTLKGGRLKTKACNPVKRLKSKSGNHKLEVSFVTRGKAGNGFQCTVTALDLCQYTEYCTALDNIRESINVTKESLEMSLQSTNETVADLQTSLQSTEDTVEDLQTSLQSTNNTVADLQTSLQSTEDTVEDLQTSLQSTNNTVADMMDKLRCKEGWKCFEYSCYFFSTEELTWEEGRAACQNMDSDYLKISTQGEFDFINSTVVSLGGSSFMWVGLNDLEVEDTFKWVSDGTLLPDQRDSPWWAPDQPNDANVQDCIYFQKEKGLGDHRCSLGRRYICEVPNRICLE